MSIPGYAGRYGAKVFEHLGAIAVFEVGVQTVEGVLHTYGADFRAWPLWLCIIVLCLVFGMGFGAKLLMSRLVRGQSPSDES